jgi:hypothetical protein
MNHPLHPHHFATLPMPHRVMSKNNMKIEKQLCLCPRSHSKRLRIAVMEKTSAHRKAQAKGQTPKP